MSTPSGRVACRPQRRTRSAHGIYVHAKTRALAAGVAALLARIGRQRNIRQMATPPHQPPCSAILSDPATRLIALPDWQPPRGSCVGSAWAGGSGGLEGSMEYWPYMAAGRSA